jgi:DNA-binding transcriptional MerR regulator
MQIGEIAERTGLSLRTIRYYEEVGLAVPSARSQGGFRLYAEPDIVRLEMIKRMKPLGFPLEEMRDLLAILDPLPDQDPIEDAVGRLAEFSETAEQRCEELRAKLHVAEEFATLLRGHLARARRARRRPAAAHSRR